MALAALAAGCRPAEETIADTGLAAFVATFETTKDAQALWEEDGKVLVVDSGNAAHRFSLDYGAGSTEGEFSGDITPKTSVKYVAYCQNAAAMEYNSDDETFVLNVPSTYNAKAADMLVTANNAAIGILQGSQVELKSICGFIKFTLEPNGKTFNLGGEEIKLTDIRKVSMKAGDGHPFAGSAYAKWNASAYVPEILKIDGGSDCISFSARSIPDSEGNICYQAGDYYIPVFPQTYENVVISIEDSEGNKTSLTPRSIDVQRATGSNLGSVEWPTVVLSALFRFDTKAESQQHSVYAFSSENLMCPRVSNTTGQRVEGKSENHTVIDFEHQGNSYQLFATGGYGKSTNTSGCLLALMFNTYTLNWNYSSDTWTVGSPNGYAWVRIPEHEGILTRIELTVISKDGTPVNISSEVDPETGEGKADIVASRSIKAASSTYETITLTPENVKPGIAYYICMGNGHSYRLQGWKFYYKTL